MSLIPRAPAEPSMIDSEIDCAASALTTNTGHARDMLGTMYYPQSLSLFTLFQ